jgi:hypothetical protein
MSRLSSAAMGVAGVLALPAFALSATQAAQASQPRAEIELYGTGQLGVGVGLFVPFVLDDGTVVFGNGWLDYRDGGAVSGSLGIGARNTVGDWVLGAHGHLDITSSPRGFTYQQISAGLEALSRDYEFRLNGYAPVGTTANEVDAASAVDIGSGQFLYRQGYEVALYGLEAEAGLRLPVFEADSASSLRVFGGAFVNGSQYTDATFGVGLRSELSLSLDSYVPGASIAFGGGVRLDSNSTVSGALQIRVSAPIGGPPPPSGPADPLYQRVERDSRVAFTEGAFGQQETAFASNGSSRVMQISSADGPTSQINPQIAAAGDGAILLASGDIVVDDTLVLATNQMLFGGGGVVELTTASGRSTRYVNSGAPTTLTASLTAPVRPDGIRLADGTVVSTLGIAGMDNGIVADSVLNIRVEAVTVSGSDGHGISLHTVTGAVITGSTIRDTAICDVNSQCSFQYSNPSFVQNAAISAVGVQNLTVRDTAIDGSTFGIFVASDIDTSGWPTVVNTVSSDIAIENVSIANTRREAMMMVGATDITIDRIDIDNSNSPLSADLITLMGSQNVTISNGRLRGGVNAIMSVTPPGTFGAITQNVSVSDIDISDTRGSGIFLNPSHDFTFNNVRISNAAEYGLHLYGDSSGFAGGPLRGIVLDGVSVEGGISAFYIAGPIENIHGALSYSATQPCTRGSTWTPPTITQDPGHVFTANGVEMTTAVVALCP